MDSTTKIYLNMTLEKGEIFGEAGAGGYKDRIDIDTFRFAAKAKKQSLKDVDNKNVSGNLQFETFTFSKVFDRSSLHMANALREHKRFESVLVAVDQQLVDQSLGSPERNEILFITLESGYIANITMQTNDGGKSGSSIKENVTLAFKKCRISYYAYAGSRVAAGKILGNDYRLDNTHIFESTDTEQGQ
jgi:type VI protein secretion system component Hcp